MRSNDPCTTEKIYFLWPSWTSSVITAANFLRFLDPVSLVGSTIIQSPASNNLNGKGFDLFYKIVLNNPGNKVVLPVWNSFVLAF